jgi:competence protein ComEA
MPTQTNHDLPPVKTSSKSNNNLIFTVIGIIIMALVGGGIVLTQMLGGSPPNSRLESAKVTTTPTLVITTPTPAVSPTPVPEIKVYVTGEVSKPGVYTMKSGDRVEDAVKAAGGFTAEADQSRLELALRVRDEMRIIVPKINLPSADPAISGGTAITPTPSDGKINVNTASAAELDRLPGIGEVLSVRIVEHRTKNGAFKSVDDLRKVSGLNNSVIEKIKDLISF